MWNHQNLVLGLKLFILYINNLCEVSEILQFVLYAGDANFLISRDDKEKLTDSIGNKMGILKHTYCL